MCGNEKRFVKALVIFLDILGSQGRNDFNELFRINELFHSELLGNKSQDRDYIAYQRHIYTFSDCAYIIYDYKNGSTSNLDVLFDVALLNCEPLLMRFLSNGLLVRGGVAYGDVYYDETKNMFFGDAVNRAYRYESMIAQYPRIVIDEYVAKKVIKFTKAEDKRRGLKNIDGILTFNDHVGCIVSLDLDGKYYLNYFNSIQHGRDYSLIIKKSNKKFLEDIISTCDEQIVVFKENKNIRTKYEWLKSYAEQSINGKSDGVVVYTKLFWDKIFGEWFTDQTLKFINHMSVANVGIPYSIEEQLEMFKELNNPETLETLQQVDEMDEPDE